MGIFFRFAYEMSVRQTCLYKKKVMFGLQFMVVRIRTKRFSTAFVHIQNLGLKVVGFIAPLSLIIDGQFTSGEKKEG